MLSMKTIMQRSDEMWKLVAEKKLYKSWEGFEEIKKFEDLLRANGIQYDKNIEDGGKTIICKSNNGKVIGKVRENCFSYGSEMDLLEVYGLFKKTDFIGYQSAQEALFLVMKSLTSYKESKPQLLLN